jgi:Peptidase C13 family
MLKELALATALWSGAALGAGGAYAQQGDPLGGAFGAVEGALSPAEAADQVELTARALSSIAPQRRGVVDTYVLSVSFWNDPVFENEAREAAAVLGRRFDAAERTIVLSAGRGAGIKRVYPNASPNNFQAALGKIGRTIDPNEDLVVVFFTSHGGPDGAVAVQEKNRMYGALRPAHLRASLAAAGIRRQVVIVSACFSGNFILPFSDPNSVILTAAAADKTSFGCEPSRDWTYFGDAFFNHALRGGDALVASYDDALSVIANWENDLLTAWNAKSLTQKAREPRPEPSNPQKNVGEAALALATKAESYGIAISCAAHLQVALDRAKSARGFKGLMDPVAVGAAKSAADARAIAEGAPRGRSAQDTAKAITTYAASALQIYTTQPANVAAHALRCSQKAAD